MESEITFLQKLKDNPKLKNHVPDLIEGEDICISGAVDSTGRYREQIGGMHKSRSHRHLVMTMDWHGYEKPVGKCHGLAWGTGTGWVYPTLAKPVPATMG